MTRTTKKKKRQQHLLVNSHRKHLEPTHVLKYIRHSTNKSYIEKSGSPTCGCNQLHNKGHGLAVDCFCKDFQTQEVSELSSAFGSFEISGADLEACFVTSVINISNVFCVQHFQFCSKKLTENQSSHVLHVPHSSYSDSSQSQPSSPALPASSCVMPSSPALPVSSCVMSCMNSWFYFAWR